MLELFALGVIVIMCLAVLIALPLMLLGRAFKLLAAIVLFPFKVLGALFKNLGPVLTHLYDFVIIAPLRLERLWTRRHQRSPAVEETAPEPMDVSVNDPYLESGSDDEPYERVG